VLVPIKSRLPPEGAFDPEIVRIMTAAFEDAWRTLNSNGAVGPHTDAARDLLAKHIIGMAQAGERDLTKLRDGAIAFMQEGGSMFERDPPGP
jgi:hypothetical protein